MRKVRSRARTPDSLPAQAHAVEVEIDDGRRVERQHLAEDQATHDRDAERTAQLGPWAAAESERQAAEERGHRRHLDRAEQQKAGLEERVLGLLGLLAVRPPREG